MVGYNFVTIVLSHHKKNLQSASMGDTVLQWCTLTHPLKMCICLAFQSGIMTKWVHNPLERMVQKWQDPEAEGSICSYRIRVTNCNLCSILHRLCLLLNFVGTVVSIFYQLLYNQGQRKQRTHPIKSTRDDGPTMQGLQTKYPAQLTDQVLMEHGVEQGQENYKCTGHNHGRKSSTRIGRSVVRRPTYVAVYIKDYLHPPLYVAVCRSGAAVHPLQHISLQLRGSKC